MCQLNGYSASRYRASRPAHQTSIRGLVSHLAVLEGGDLVRQRGTADAKRALMTDRQLADRFEAVELPPWRNDESYSRLLASYGAVLPLRRRSELTSPAVRKALLDHTQGITVCLVRAMENLAIEAIRSGRECISQESLEALGTFPPLLSMEERSSALA